MESDFSAHTVKFLTDDDLPGLEIRSSCYQRCSFSKHAHDTWSVGTVLSGHGKYTQKETAYSIGPGDIVLIPPDEVHACNPSDKSFWAYLMFHVSHQLLLQVIVDLIGDRTDDRIFRSRIIRDPEIHRHMIRLFQLVKHGATSREKEAALFAVLSGLLLRDTNLASCKSLETHEPQMVRVIKEYLADNLEKNVSMHELSKVARVSVYHMLHVFRRTVGMTPHAFQVQMRIKEARKLLLKGYSIVDAALETGFYDQSHFTKKFKPIVGLTPRRYVLAHHSS